MGNSNYPGQLDSDLELPRVDDNITEIGGDAINSLRDAVFSIEEALGTNIQGNVQDLVTRVNQVIDDDGQIIVDALDGIGLVSLPITNAHVGSNAGIQESKLDLDYSSTTLHNNIVSVSTDIDTVRDTLNSLSSQILNHFSGTQNRHDGYDVDLLDTVRGESYVESAIHTVNNYLAYHESSPTGSHTATSVSVVDEFANISATNVQSALVALDDIGSSDSHLHQEYMHDNGTSLNINGEQGDYGNIRDTVLAGTIYQTDITKSANIFQVMRPNVARVTGDVPDLRSLDIAYAKILRIQAGGIGRTYLNVDLSGIIPTDNLDNVVVAINEQAHAYATHYPISAYNTGGRLTIAHNIPGYEFTIKILNPTNSAATMLGFSGVLNTTIEWSGVKHSGYAGGRRVVDLKSLVKIHFTHSSTPLNQFNLGLGDLSNYGISTDNEGRIICNITNHSTTSTDNGTHYITSFPTSSSITLSSDIQQGEFDLEIVADSVNFSTNARYEVFDAFVEYDDDGYGTVTKSRRIIYNPISGVKIAALSENLPHTSNIEWQIIDAEYLMLYENGIGGEQSIIPSGYTGTIDVKAADNVNTVSFEVTGTPNPTNARRTITVSEFAGSGSKMYVGSVHFDGSNTLSFPTDRRKMGASIENKTHDTFKPDTIEDYQKELRNNGVIRGLNIISNDGDSCLIRGGRALVDGRIVDVETKEITVDEFSTGTRLLLLDRYGHFFIRSEFDGGFTFEEMTTGDSYGDNRDVAIIAEFETNGIAIDGYFSDRRLMVNKLDKRVLDNHTSVNNQITQLRNTTQGSSWGFTIAEAFGAGDGYLASIEMGNNNGFAYIPYTGETPISARGFAGGNASITTRRFEFTDQDTIKTSIFKAVGLTHINVFVEANYTGITSGVNGPFGVSGTVYVDLGAAVETGMDSITVNEAYARVRTIYSGVMASNSVTERYVASIPVSQLNLASNVMFDVVPRVKIVNSNYVDGGSGADPEPTIRFDNIRIVTSSYSVAGYIEESDGLATSIGTIVGEIL